MMQPSKQKFRKEFRGKMRGTSKLGTRLANGEFGLVSTEAGWLSSRQLESARRAISHYTKRGGKVWIRVFPSKPITQKAAGMRMGSGKAPVSGFVAVVKPGMVVFEMSGVTLTIAKEAFRRAGHKLPIAMQVVDKESFI